jgi:hypothetical protein
LLASDFAVARASEVDARERVELRVHVDQLRGLDLHAIELAHHVAALEADGGGERLPAKRSALPSHPTLL